MRARTLPAQSEVETVAEMPALPGNPAIRTALRAYADKTYGRGRWSSVMLMVRDKAGRLVEMTVVSHDD